MSKSESSADDFSSTINPSSIQMRWQSPSNLAIVKYWGKFGTQFPRNPSISLTLCKAYTDTCVSLLEKTTAKDIELDFFFEGQANLEFQQKIEEKLQIVKDNYPFLSDYKLKIESSNTFPHSSGIASSASSMSALALCLGSLEMKLSDGKEDQSFLRKASYTSRLFSGSASRSVFPYVSMWGESEAFAESSNEFAIDIQDQVHEVFKSFHDDILLVSKSEKSVSSTAGHALMDGNVYAQNRYDQARARTIELAQAMKTGDIEHFGKIAEDEALTLHALMMCSDPSYILMEGHSIEMIKRIRHYRQSSKVPVYFSLDAGPNIHLLYPKEFSKPVSDFVNSELKSLCVNGEIIKDIVGPGPKKM